MADQGSQGYLSPFLQKKRIRKVLDFIPSDGDVLDYGCGNGNLCVHIDRARYTGFDLDIAVIQIAKRKYPAYTFLSGSLGEIKKKYDLIILLAVIEHVEDISQTLMDLSDMLNANGRIILTSPSPAFEKIYNLGSRIGLFSKDAAEEHHQLINKKSLQGFLSRTDLRLVVYQRFLFGANQLFVLEKEMK